jgi:cell shape-determining protein MreC
VAAYQGTGMDPQQVRTLRAQLLEVADARDTFAEEAKMLSQRAEDLARRLARYEGPQEPQVELPVGLVGRVVAVDPRYDFVVLDIGAEDGVKEDGQMLVNRNGQLVARVQVTRVEQNRSIANVLPQWKQDDVMEGDVVFY